MPGKPRIVFMGTPEFAVPSLAILVEHGYDIAAVITVPDRPAGRGMKLQASAVKQFALEKGLPVLQPEKFKEPSFQEAYRNLHHDLNIVVAFRMLPQSVWAYPPMGTFNLHGSLLPQYRGAAPINWAVINGEKETGVTTFFINAEIDTGNIILQRTIPILPEDNAGSLHDKMMMIGAELVLETVKTLEKGDVRLTDQTQIIENQNIIIKSAPKIFKDDCLLQWDAPLAAIHNRIRGLSPYPAAQISLSGSQSGELALKIYRSSVHYDASPGKHGDVSSDGKTYIALHHREGLLYLEELQAPGRKRLPVEDFLRGFPLLTEHWQVKPQE